MPMVAEKLLAFGIHGLRGELHVSWEEGTGRGPRAELLYEQLDGLQGCDEPCARSYWRRAGNNADDAVTPPENQYSLWESFILRYPPRCLQMSR